MITRTNNNDQPRTDIFTKMINYEDRRPVATAEQEDNNSNSKSSGSSNISNCRNNCSSSSLHSKLFPSPSPPSSTPPHPFPSSPHQATTNYCINPRPRPSPIRTPTPKKKAISESYFGTGTATGTATESGNSVGVGIGSGIGNDIRTESDKEYNYKTSLPSPSNSITKETISLQCPHCYKSLHFPMYERPVPVPVIKTTDKRRLNRFCGFFAIFLSLFLLLSSLLESADIDNDALISGTHYWTSQPYKIKRLPSCIIIGARKCGTRALIDMLNLHPQVEKAAMEVHFFDRDENYAKGLEWYRQHLPECSEDQLSIEKSPSYFVTPEVAERVWAMNSSIKLLLIVREPVTRVISDYTQIYGTNLKPHNGSKSPRLEDLVLQSDGSVNVHYKAVRISLYSRYLQRWLDVFPPTQIHVIDGDALIRDPYPQLRDVERFLGLEPRLQRDNFYFNSTKGFYCWRKLDGESRNETGLHCLNDSKGRRHPPVDRHIVSKLRRFYNPHNLRFYDMVGRDFSWPDK